MLISPRELRRSFHLRPRRILHVGAHTGEEAELYSLAGWAERGVTWVEALPQKVQELSLTLELVDREIESFPSWRGARMLSSLNFMRRPTVNPAAHSVYGDIPFGIRRSQ